MHLPVLCRILLVFLVSLCAGPAMAELDQTYEGMLVPNDFQTPIPITVQLKEQSGQLTGTITTGAPFLVTAPIVSGENKYGQCNMKIALTPSFTLRLYGSCQLNTFDGRYTLYTTSDDDRPRGVFRLTRKEIKRSEQEDEPRRRTPERPSGSVTDCIKANTRCLLACPQGDYNAEFLCSNRCRHKYQACKARFAPALPPLGSGSLPAPSR